MARRFGSNPLSIYPVHSESRDEDVPGRFDTMLVELRETGFRISRQRLAVLKIPADSKRHPGAEGICAELKTDFPTESVAAVYKTPAVLKSESRYRFIV
jgi:hypothetical protein